MEQKMTEENQRKFEQASTLLEKVRVMLDDMRNPEVVYDKVREDVTTVEDVALIQCFYGTNATRIRATMQALEFNLWMTSRPSTWVFVECQKRKSDCAFGWLSRYGIKYVFVKMPEDSDGIMLKQPLWNIGAESCSESRLCFLDSDVVMCQSDWLDRVVSTFSDSDVVSLASHQYYQSDDRCILHETVGYRVARYGIPSGGHCGFTFGITRKFFERLGGLQPAVILDDILTYWKIFGDEVFKSFRKWTQPFVLERGMESGYNVRVGYADNMACHIWHGDMDGKYEQLVKLLCEAAVKSAEDMFESVSGKLPTWRKTPRAQALKNVIQKYNAFLSSLVGNSPTLANEFNIVDKYRFEMQKLLGIPDEKHQLYVCTVAKDGFGMSLEEMVKFRNRIEDRFKFHGKIRPIVMLFTDARFDFKANDINDVPLLNYERTDEFAQCMRSDLKYPKNAVVYYIPFGLEDFNCDIWIPDGRVDNSDGTVLCPV